MARIRASARLQGLGISSFVLGLLGLGLCWWTPTGMVLSLAGLMVGLIGCDGRRGVAAAGRGDDRVGGGAGRVLDRRGERDGIHPLRPLTVAGAPCLAGVVSPHPGRAQMHVPAAARSRCTRRGGSG